MRSIAAILLTCLAQPALAQFAGYTVDTTRWGFLGPAVGVGGCTIEDFEDATLAPGLTVSWVSAAGNSGPFATLPNTFNPSTDDAFGSAFVGGAWSGLHCLVNTRTNRPFTYPDGSNWGDVILSFSTPARFVAFSFHQSELSPTVVINGVPRGTLASLAATPTSSTRNGYVILRATGAEPISTLTLDNTGGDGFTIDYLAFSDSAGPSVSVTNIPPSQWSAPDSDLGVFGASIENFEDASLISGLSVAVESANGNYGPSATLPRAFNPTVDDGFGDAFDLGVWDGAHCLVNTRANNAFPYADVGSWGDIVLAFDSPLNVVGFSLADMDLATRLIVNGRDVGDLRNLAGGPLHGRQGYYVIATDDPARLSSVRLANGRVGFGDGLALDHLALLRTCPADFNQDGNTDQGDIDYLINVVGGGENPAARDPDFNGDGNVDQGDIDALIDVIGGGACP